MRLKNLLLLLSLAPALLDAQEEPAPGIQDNSFLIEEAYNQEAGIVQHIGIYRSYRGTSDFEAGFAQEWPLGGIRHQLSYDVPFIRSARESGIGDVSLNYRYQWIGSGLTQLAVAPRISVILPTGDWKRGRGAGTTGVEFFAPMSHVISPLLTQHVNAGAAFSPSARNTAGEKANTFGITLGHSFVVTANPNFQLMLETVYDGTQEVIGESSTEWIDDLVISPGFRTALNFDSGLQIVPGLAFPIGAGPGSGSRGVLLYLSFEHAFKRTDQRR
ncbi:MAG: transporter [Gemmatimonadaceae bacterium]